MKIRDNPRRCKQIFQFEILFFCSGIQRTVQEVRAGPTYSSNIEDQDVEVTTIPPPIPKPGPAGLDTTGKEFVFFDLETRGLGKVYF